MALTFTQYQQNFSGGVTSIAKAYGSATTLGSLLICYVFWLGGGTLSVSDPTNGQWAALKTVNNAGWVRGIFAVPANAGNTALTVTGSTTGSSSSMALAIAEYTGQGMSPLDDIEVATVGNGGSAPTLNLNYSSSETAIVAGWSGTNATAAAGFTFRAPGTGNFLWEDGTLTGPGTEAGTWTSNATGANAVFSVSLIDNTVPGCSTPSFEPPTGRYAGSSLPVTIYSATAGSTIYYTTDGSTPTHGSASIPMGGSVTLNASGTIKALASKAGDVDSVVTSATYTLGVGFNAWHPQGNIFTDKCNPNVIYDTNPAVLTTLTNVFKMWIGVNNGVTGIYYYESQDGRTNWTPHPSNPIVSGAGAAFPTVYKVRSTYYLYTNALTTPITVQTSSDGVTFGAKTTAIRLGTAGTWDSANIAQLNLVPGGGPTYYAYYEGYGVGGSFEGLATSTDLINWTKDPSGQPTFRGVAPMTFAKVGSTYYAWAPNSYSADMAALHGGFNGLSRWSAPSPTGRWTLLNSSGTNVIVNYTTLAADFHPSNNALGAALQDPYLIEANGNVYIYWTRTTTPGFQLGANMSVAYNTTLAQLVAGYEGVYGFPIPGFNFNLNTLASDNFQRADANPIGGNWTQIHSAAGYTTSQIASNLVEPSAAGSWADSYYNAVAFPNDQWSQITVQTNNSSLTGPDARMNTSGADTCYRVYWRHIGGNLGSTGTLGITRYIAGSGNTLNTFTALPLQRGDKLMLVTSGSNLLVYYNGYPILAATDPNITSGAAGFCLNANSLVTDAQISAWAGGNTITYAPPVVPPIGHR